MSISVVIFGDPFNGTAIANIDPSKVMIICHTNDYICKGSSRLSPDHANVSFNSKVYVRDLLFTPLQYQNDAATAAAFAVKMAGLELISHT